MRCVLSARGAVALLVLAAGSLGIGAAATEQSKETSRKECRVLEGVAHENVTLFPVTSEEWTDTNAFLTLDEALESGQASVTERGSLALRRSRDGRPFATESDSVDRLVLISRASKPLLLLAGEVLSGGKQDRVVSKDRIVPPGAEPVPLDVFCVERGRWAGTTTGFSAAKMMVHPSVREKTAVDQSQGEVWAAVRGNTPAARVVGGTAGGLPAAPPPLSRAALESIMTQEVRTESYDRLYKSPRVSGPVEVLADELASRFDRATAKVKGVVGVVVTYGSEVAWSDRFASSELFRRYWPKLLRSYAVEALSRPPSTERASREEAQEFLRSFGPEAGETLETEPGVYRWRQVGSTRYAEIELQALTPRALTLHWMKLRRSR